MIKLVASDLDGTLLLHKAQSLPEEIFSLSRQLEELIEDRKNILAQQGDSKFVRITLDDTGHYHDQAISTIICEGDAIGAVVLYEKNDAANMGETESKLAITAAGFLGRQMEQ